MSKMWALTGVSSGFAGLDPSQGCIHLSRMKSALAFSPGLPGVDGFTML